jgi:ribosome-binding protein aMBF1 (putative translation factor)
MKKNITLKWVPFEDVLKEELKSEAFRKGYNEELARLRIAKQIRDMRTKKGLTQADIAKKASMPQSVIARIESGQHACTLGTIDRIAHVFNKKIILG